MQHLPIISQGLGQNKQNLPVFAISSPLTSGFLESWPGRFVVKLRYKNKRLGILRDVARIRGWCWSDVWQFNTDQ